MISADGAIQKNPHKKWLLLSGADHFIVPADHDQPGALPLRGNPPAATASSTLRC